MWQRMFNGRQSEPAPPELAEIDDDPQLSDNFIIGDIHGQFDQLVGLLFRANLIDHKLAWSGEGAHLYFMGDFFDRGNGGLAALTMVMRLQAEAADAGGSVEMLVGNHEVLILATKRFGDQAIAPWTPSFYEVWLRNGGLEDELEGLTQEQIAWLIQRPAMVRVLDRLLVHADSDCYQEYGDSASSVNASVGKVLAGDDLFEWNRLFCSLCERKAFSKKSGGVEEAESFLESYGGRQIVHGHTPICYITKQKPQMVRQPLAYAENLCVNVDGGLYLGGPGFVHQLTVAETQ
ncbi:MAG: serine/threonine protein phosphatase [Caldilineaceae bacterium]|nr:serine/threonine protein phosphatase [Caldilineaceae bacterium]